MLTSSVIVPHPPVAIPSVGGEEGIKPVEKTVKAMLEVSQHIAESKPDTIVVISPHGPVYPDRICLRMPGSNKLEGDMQMFGSEEGLKVGLDRELADKIIDEATSAGLKVLAEESDGLDHGVLVPMHYVSAAHNDVELVSVNISFSGFQTHYDFGKVLRKVFDESDKKIAFVASADLSHCLTENAPGEYSPVGKEFDEKLVELLKAGDTESILAMDPFWVDEAQECGLRSICTALGVAEKYDVLSYEGPYGVGYCVAVSR